MAYDEAKYAGLVDEILQNSDLNTISAKRIRKQLADKLGYDITEHKTAVNKLIEKRFDKLNNAVNAADKDGENGASDSKSKSKRAPEPATSPLSTTNSSPNKRPADDSELSDVVDSPKPKKKRVKTNAEDEDAAFAARLQAEENSRARPTRGGATKKKAPAKQKKKKSAAKVKDDSDESGGEEPKERKGGFHKPLALSDPLAELLGVKQESRPQTVKKLWEYIKAQELQDPSDKRQIRCDDAMRAVFKQDRVHMFTMMKTLNQNLFAIDE